MPTLAKRFAVAPKLAGFAARWKPVCTPCASAVLLFAVPASPLAQPWSIMGGNTVSALVGVSCALLLGPTGLAAGLAGVLAIAFMFSLRCLHPPGGAVAMTAVLGGSAVTHLGYQFAFWPVALNSALMLLAALLFNRLARRRYPHHRVVGWASPTTT